MSEIVVGHRWPLDIERIIEVSETHLKLKMSVDEADNVWTNYSDKYAAGWLSLPEDDTYLANIIKLELEKVDSWKTNDEHRASLRMALYEVKRDEPIKTYNQLGKEFGISATDANKLVIEYCILFSLPEPPVVLIPGKPYDRNKRLLIGEIVDVNGRSGVLIEECNHYMKILFDDTRVIEVVNRIDLSIN